MAEQHVCGLLMQVRNSACTGRSIMASLLLHTVVCFLTRATALLQMHSFAVLCM